MGSAVSTRLAGGLGCDELEPGALLLLLLLLLLPLLAVRVAVVVAVFLVFLADVLRALQVFLYAGWCVSLVIIFACVSFTRRGYVFLLIV